MRVSGMTASQLIAALRDLIDQHGDQPVFCGGEDYPGPVTAVVLKQRSSPYIPQGSFQIQTSS